MKALLLTIFIMGVTQAHEMQHGFIISDNESYFSHLVATGHHSRQTNFAGKLSIRNELAKANFIKRKTSGKYFLFQAQRLDLPKLQEGQVLQGHIIESAEGDYTPQNVVVSEAELVVTHIYLNLMNPFFSEE